MAGLTDKTYRPSMEALEKLCKSGMTKPEMLAVLPQLFDFVAKGIRAQAAVDQVLELYRNPVDFNRPGIMLVRDEMTLLRGGKETQKPHGDDS
jgi:hypothetical protein